MVAAPASYFRLLIFSLVFIRVFVALCMQTIRDELASLRRQAWTCKNPDCRAMNCVWEIEFPNKKKHS